MQESEILCKPYEWTRQHIDSALCHGSALPSSLRRATLSFLPVRAWPFSYNTHAFLITEPSLIRERWPLLCWILVACILIPMQGMQGVYQEEPQSPQLQIRGRRGCSS